MNLKECLIRLSQGELSNLAVGNSGNSSIDIDKIPMVVNALNEALLRIYTSTILKKSCVYINIRPEKSQYHISSRHAISNEASTEIKYIQDTKENPYKDDLIKVLDVFNASGKCLPINNHTDLDSVFTPVFDVIQIPTPNTSSLAVTYQAKHPKLNWESCPTQEINLPEPYYGALFAYTAYSVFTYMNSKDAKETSQMYFNQYQVIMMQLIDNDISSSSYSQTNTHFSNGGWV